MTKELTKEDFLSLVDKYFDSFKHSLKELVAIPSVLDEYRPNTDAPFGEGNKKALEYMLSLGKKMDSRLTIKIIMLDVLNSGMLKNH